MSADARQALAALLYACEEILLYEGNSQPDIDRLEAAKTDARAALSAQPVAGAVATDETRWLIEHSGEILPGAEQRAQVSWLRVQMKFNGYGAREFGFTHDANEALRFARKEDAEAVLAMHLGASPPDWYSKPFSVTEHMWPAASQAQAAPAPEPSEFDEGDGGNCKVCKRPIRYGELCYEHRNRPAPEPSAQAVAHPSHQTVREWMPVSEALRLSDLWTAGDLDNCGQWRAAIKVLADEVRALAASPQPAQPSAQGEAVAWYSPPELNGFLPAIVRLERDASSKRVQIPLFLPEARVEAMELTDKQIDRIAENCVKAMPDGIQGFCNTWGWRQFARELLDICRGHYRASAPAAPAQPSAQGEAVDE